MFDQDDGESGADGKCQKEEDKLFGRQRAHRDNGGCEAPLAGRFDGNWPLSGGFRVLLAVRILTSMRATGRVINGIALLRVSAGPVIGNTTATERTTGYGIAGSSISAVGAGERGRHGYQ